LGTLVEIAIGGEHCEAIDAAFEDISLIGPHWLQ